MILYDRVLYRILGVQLFPSILTSSFESSTNTAYESAGYRYDNHIACMHMHNENQQYDVATRGLKFERTNWMKSKK